MMFLIYCGRLYPPCDFHAFPLYTERHLFSQTLCRARAISLIVSEAFSIVRRLSSLKSCLTSFCFRSSSHYFTYHMVLPLGDSYIVVSLRIVFFIVPILATSHMIKISKVGIFLYFWTFTKFVGILISLTFGIFHIFQEG